MKTFFQKATVIFVCVICIIGTSCDLEQKPKSISLPEKPTAVKLDIFDEFAEWNLVLEENKPIDLNEDEIAELVKLIDEGTPVGQIALACDGDLIFSFENYPKMKCLVSLYHGYIGRREEKIHFTQVDHKKLVSLLLGGMEKTGYLLESFPDSPERSETQ